MYKEQAIARIQEDLGQRPEVLGACRAIVEFLAHEPPAHLRRLSFGMLSRAAGLNEVSDVLPAVQYLTSGRLYLLHPKYVLIFNDDEEELEPEEIAEARRTQVLSHPSLGEPIPDFERFVHMYFTLTEDGKGLSARAAK